MADLGNADRYIEQALVALKKGSQLLKYGRKGKPKVYPFRLSSDETSLIWISNRGEKSLKLASVSRIIPGQRTAVFRRYLCPEKDYLSFSLIYNSGRRSLDVICKDKVEAEFWIAGLKVLISSRQAGCSKVDGSTDGSTYIDDNRDLMSHSPSSSFGATKGFSSPDVSLSLNINISTKSYGNDDSLQLKGSPVALDKKKMQVKGSGSDASRISVSSAPSTSSHGSAQDDCDARGDVYVWGEITCDSFVKVGPEKNSISVSLRADVLLPKPLECNIVLDVHHIACGVRHAALVTRQGEVFSWGEESGGRLGHGVGKDITQPRLVESLCFSNVDHVECGEFHTCAVTVAGELYTWGDGTHNAGLLGHGSNVSHWIPRRISGSLEGLQVAIVACGPWHTALVTSTGQLFTFGDGTFGVLGHGNREKVSYPREVESLSGLRTISVACGVWHTAAVVEVIVTQLSISSGKLFTWGDGDKNSLGHGDKEARLHPTCVSAVIDYDFHKVACGHSLTVGLTTSGSVLSMGSTVHGQLGNPKSDGKLPCFIEDKLAGEYIEEIACGAYHVAVLTSKNEVYTWGKGGNGRLGHGDMEDRKTPTIVEALKDRHIKFIACGSNYTAAICVHKWVSGSEQSQCAACRQSFGFTRKRHNCYNCGLVYCHACSSKKALQAALAPNPSKPHRVCDSCFAKLSNVTEVEVNGRRNALPRLSGENKNRLDKGDLRSAKSATQADFNLIEQLDTKAVKQGKKADPFSVGRSSQLSSLLQLKDAVMSTAVDAHRTVPRPVSNADSRSVSPFSRNPSPPRSAMPVPTKSGLSFSNSITDSLTKSNEFLNREVRKLRVQVESLRSRCEMQELELQKSAKGAQEAMALAAEESVRSKAAKEVIKSLTAQLKVVAERLPPGAYDHDCIKMALPVGLETNIISSRTNGEKALGSDTIHQSYLSSRPGIDSNAVIEKRVQTETPRNRNENNSSPCKLGLSYSNGMDDHQDVKLPNGGGGVQPSRDSVCQVNSIGSGFHQDGENGSRTTNSLAVATSSEIEEWIEQYEAGVYITLVALRDGTRDLKRVRFSRRRFREQQAETWWSENREKVYLRYNIRASEKSLVSGQAASNAEGVFSL